MVSNRTWASAARRARRPLALTLPIAFVFCVFCSRAQEGEDLSDLILERMPLAAAKAAPLDLGGRSDRELRALRNSVDDHLAGIEPLRAAGSSSPDLIEQLALLGVAYQGLERHDEALDVLDEAVALTVRNGGEDNLEQIPLLEQKIPSYLARDDFRAIDETEERIYELNAGFYGPTSRQMYYATINLADWNTAAYFLENYRQTGTKVFQRLRNVLSRPPRALADTTGSNENPIFNGAIKGINKQDIIDTRLRRIDRLYVGFQDAVAESGAAQLDVVMDIARRIARLAFLTKQEMDFERDNYAYDPDYEGSLEQAARNSPDRMQESYDAGRLALDYLLGVLGSVDGVRPEALAAAHLDMGDWHLAYGKLEAATASYGNAYAALLEAGFTSPNVDKALATALPPVIPLFATHLYSKASAGLAPTAEVRFRGFVDLAYAVDALGNASGLEFIGRSEPDTKRIEAMIRNQFRSLKFRPTLTGAELSAPGRVEARYYYSY